MTVTATARGRANRNKGAWTERVVARYLRTQGFPHAKRAVHNGYRTPEQTAPDPLDIAGIPGVVISVKNDASNQITKWLDQAERIGNNHGADLALLVVRRSGKAEIGRWWVWVSLPALARSLTGNAIIGQPWNGHVCLELGELVPMLHAAGYGDPSEEATP